MLKVFFLGLMPLSAMGQAQPDDGNPLRHPLENLSSVSNVMDAVQAIADRPLYEVVLVIDQTPRPEDNGGNIFLAGFLEVEEEGYPATGLIPSDYQQLGVWVQTWPYRREVRLVDGLHYYVQYGYSEAPAVEDRVSMSFSVDSQPSEPIQLNISLDSPYGAIQSQGSGPARDPALAGVSVERRLTVNFDPPLSDLGGSIFLTGFSSVEEATGMPDRESDPVDFNTVTDDLNTAPFEAEVSLVPGLHYFAMYGHGIHPEPEDRMSTGAIFSEGDEALELTIGALTTPLVDEDEDRRIQAYARWSASEVENPDGSQLGASDQMSTPPMQNTREMMEGYVKKWAGVALLGGLFIGGFVGWFLRGRVR